jgi:hypothetical protein
LNDKKLQPGHDLLQTHGLITIGRPTLCGGALIKNIHRACGYFKFLIPQED